MNPMVESECSVFEKLAIIQTSPHGEAWLASHLRLFYDSNYGDCRFGEWNALYPPEYYEDIALIAAGTITGLLPVFLIGAACLNSALGLLFLSLSPQFIEKGSR